MSTPAIRTGFIGLGSQGGPMAERLRTQGFPLRVWARRPEVRADDEDASVPRAATDHFLGPATRG